MSKYTSFWAYLIPALLQCSGEENGVVELPGSTGVLLPLVFPDAWLAAANPALSTLFNSTKLVLGTSSERADASVEMG